MKILPCKNNSTNIVYTCILSTQRTNPKRKHDRYSHTLVVIKKMIEKLTIFLALITTFTGFSQIPIGKDINQGKVEFINIMKENGFTFFKESKDEFPKGGLRYTILFKEEIKVIIHANKYENITDIIIFPENLKNKEKLLKIFKSDRWEFLYEKEDLLGNNEIYKVGDFYARIPINKYSYLDIHFYRIE